MEIAGVPVLALIALIGCAAWLYRRIAQSVQSPPEHPINDDEPRLVD